MHKGTLLSDVELELADNIVERAGNQGCQAHPVAELFTVMICISANISKYGLSPYLTCIYSL